MELYLLENRNDRKKEETKIFQNIPERARFHFQYISTQAHISLRKMRGEKERPGVHCGQKMISFTQQAETAMGMDKDC